MIDQELLRGMAIWALVLVVWGRLLVQVVRHLVDRRRDRQRNKRLVDRVLREERKRLEERLQRAEVRIVERREES